jgi:hypothetical protein
MRYVPALVADYFKSIEQGEQMELNTLKIQDYECTCYRDCGDDSHTGEWHQHEDEPCSVHPDAVMVG